MIPGEFRKAFIIVWLVLSVGILAILITPLLATPEQISAVIPPCEYKARYHRECLFCGMTTAFFEISRGNFHAAEQSNGGSVPLYAAFVANEFTLLLFWRKRVLL
jgi:hypothetical protein